MAKAPVDQLRSLRFKLAYNATKTWELPALSDGGMGTIIVKAESAGRGLPDGRFDDLPQLTEATLARSTQPTGPTLDPGGATRELKLELLKRAVVVASSNDSSEAGFISYPTGPDAAGDLWALRVTRTEQGSTPNQYTITVQYPSEFVTEERRIPVGFVLRGFARNWEANPLFESVTIKDQSLTYKWRPDFAALYEKPTEAQTEDLLKKTLGKHVSLPEITSIKVAIKAGPVEGDTDGLPYFDLVIKGRYAGSKAIKFDSRIQLVADAHTQPIDWVTGTDNKWFDLPSDPDDPSSISVTVRFHLHESYGAITYRASVRSPLLDAIPAVIVYPELGIGSVFAPGLATETLHLRQLVIDKILALVNTLEHQLAFDKSVRPFLVGRSEHTGVPYEQAVRSLRNDVLGVSYDSAKAEIVIKYANRRRPPLHQVDLGGSFPDVTPAEPAPEPRRPIRPLPTGPIHTATPTRPGSIHLPNAGHLPTLDFERYPPMFDTRGEVPFPPRPIPPPTPDTTPGALSKIEHIVVLMQENRSFDQVLGYLSREGILTRHGRVRQPTVDGLLTSDQRDWNQHGVNVYLSRNIDEATHAPVLTSWPAHLAGPCHGHDCVVKQVAGDMKGFADNFAEKNPHATTKELQLVMNYYTDLELPAYGALTREFAICDRWFCSFPGGTLPNRFVSLTGGLSLDKDGNAELKNPGLESGSLPIETETFFDHLSRNQISWKVFEHGYSTLRLFRNYTFEEDKVVGFADETRGFAVAARTPGKLPQVSFIEPDYIELPGEDNDDHAPADMFNGQRLVAKIMKALLDSPDGVWEKTLFIITYDEHGGFYDHVMPPPEVEITGADGSVTRTPVAPLAPDILLGLRVPAFVISPLIPPMTDDGKVNVAKTLFDHTTISATILRRFISPQPPYMGPRATAAADVGHLLTLDTPRPRSEFEALKNEMTAIAAQPQRPSGVFSKPAPVRLDTKDDDDFHGLIAYLSSVTGVGR
jgi:phospholipase C